MLNAVGLLNHMGKCIFIENWLQKDRYKHWLRHDSNNHKARCRLCSKSFDIGNMGESALVSHLKGIKHRQLEKSQTVLEKDFSSPGKVLEKSLNFILENLYEPCYLVFCACVCRRVTRYVIRCLQTYVGEHFMLKFHDYIKTDNLFLASKLGPM